MGKCNKCKATIGFFGSSVKCYHSDCTYVECSSCATAKSSGIKMCDVCHRSLCSKHIDKGKHHCEKDEYVEESDYVSEDGHYIVRISLQGSQGIEFTELSRKTAESMYEDLKKAVLSNQVWHEIDTRKQNNVSYEKRLINLTKITEIIIVGE
ncbi:MAG TPA: hypothetical protein VEC16_03880 [Alphaproteobacteria bacterium]|nr:hypothetical protein [Alphaproteobacteria bacterium]